MQSRMKELRSLKQEEMTLMGLASKINDQLNRLKVEELALQNLLHVEQDGMVKEEELQDTDDDELTKMDKDEELGLENAPLDLEVKGHLMGNSMEEEEEEEEEEDEEEAKKDTDTFTVHDDLTQFVQELSKETGS